MNLRDLIGNLDCTVYGKIQSVDINGISNNSETVGPGFLFVAKTGVSRDGNEFTEAAVKHGAVAVISSFYNPLLKIAQIICQDVYEAEAYVSQRFYKNPSADLYVIGVTGTNGKTTVTYALKHFLDAIGKISGLVGTIEHILGDGVTLPSVNTTPDAILNHKLMKEMIKNGCRAAVFEVSSIGLSHKRTHAIDFNVGVFTNLSLDHLDFHGSMEAYAYDKSKLFRGLTSDKLAIYNADSPDCDKILENCTARRCSFGLSADAEVFASDVVLETTKTKFVVHFEDKRHLFETSLIGVHNVYNLLVPIALGLVEFKMSLSDLADIISRIPAPRGRLEPIENGPCRIFVDYAHTPDGLENVLYSLQQVISKGGRLITVVGCGGDRDRTKRPQMGAIIEKYGIGVITSDNPRSEEPEEIIDDILKGMKAGNHFVEIDRRAAIAKAIEMACQNDIILIAGKGHEDYQKFKYRTVHFDDREVVREILKERIMAG